MPAAISVNDSPNPLQSLKFLLGEDLRAVDRLIEIHLQSPVPLILALGQHLIQAGGKRLRPLLTLASYRLFSQDAQGATGLAAAVEFIHTATLLHDDVVDGSSLRRGVPSANKLWGNHASVLVGDFLFARSFQLMVRCGNSQVLEILAAAAARIAEGEVLQLSISHKLEENTEELLQVVEAKTAELFAAACQVGALMAHQPDHALALRNYGRNLGMAFQIVDDILDYTACKNQLGKEAGDDFREGKITLPVILAYPGCNATEQHLLKKTLAECCQLPEDFGRVQAILQEKGGFSKSYELAAAYGNKAYQSLETLPAHPIKGIMLDLVHHCLNRHN